MMTRFLKNLLFFWISVLACSCGTDNTPGSTKNSIGSPGEGKGGSLARFAISGNYLYVVDQNSLNVYSLADPAKPTFVVKKDIGVGIETIFPYNGNLFIGAMDGMHIFSLSNPENPVKISTYTHIQSCDPVFVSGNYAYVTLRTGTRCWRGINSLDVVDISNLAAPNLVRSISMNNPKGLGGENGLLFVCDPSLTLFDLSNPASPKFLNIFPSIVANDVIATNNRLIVMENSLISQYDVKPDKSLTLLSTIN